MADDATASAGPRRVRFGLANLSIFLDEVVFFALAPLLPVYAATFGLSKAETGWLFAAYPLFSFVAAIPGAIICRRIGSRWTLVIANVVFAVATLGFGVADDALTLWTARALQGFASGITVVAAMVLVSSAGRKGRKGRTLGLAFALQGISAVGGPALGGLAVPALGAAISFAMVAVVAVTSAVILVVAGPDEVERSAVRGALRAFGSDVRALAITAEGRYPVLLFVGIGISAGCVLTLATLRLDEFGVSTEGIGLLFMVGGTVAIPLVLGVGWLCDRIGPVRATRWWLISEVTLCLALALPAGLWVLVPAMLLLLVQGRTGGTIAYAQAAGVDGAQRMAIGFGFMIMAWAVGSAVGALLAGSVADAVGDTSAYVVTALLFVTVVGPGATRDLRRCRVG